MLSWHVVEEIRARIAAGEAYRRIAREVGVARGTVHQIARNRHHGRTAPRDREEWENPDLPQGPPHRCDSCGSIVQHPCLRCRLVQMFGARKTGERSRPQDFRLLGLDLREEHRARYEAIRAQHERRYLMQQDNPDWESDETYQSPHIMT